MKKLLFLILIFPSAAACMDSDFSSHHSRNIRICPTHMLDGQKRTHPHFVTKTNEANPSPLSEATRPALAKLRLNPEVDYKSLFAEWGMRTLFGISRFEPENRMENIILVVRMGADLCYQKGSEAAPTLIYEIANSNRASIVHATITHIKEYYPIKKLESGRKNIFTLFCCLLRSNIKIPRDVKRLLIDKCTADLLMPPPEHFERFVKVLAHQRRMYGGAYQAAQNIPHITTRQHYADGTESEPVHLQLTYDPELLNPETARAQHDQTYLDNCARFRKTIFKKDE